MSGLAELGKLWHTIGAWLFPVLEDELGELDDRHREFVVPWGRDMRATQAPGRLPLGRQRLPAQGPPGAVQGIHRQGRVGLSHHQRPDRRRPPPPHVAPPLRLGNARRDSLRIHLLARLRRLRRGSTAAIHPPGHAQSPLRRQDRRTHQPRRHRHPSLGDEKAAKKEPKPVAPPVEGQAPVSPEPTRLQRQLERTQDENLADLPSPRDDWGTKKDSKGKKQTWRGYKLHLDVVDGDLPVSWLLTSASLHDSQAAIPLAQMSAERITSLYDLADAAYDAAPIRQMSVRLGHVALIDHNPRRGEKKEFAPAEAIRYRQRSSAERVNSHLHDNHGGRHVRVRGAVKVAAHLSFGLLVIAAEQLLTMLC